MSSVPIFFQGECLLLRWGESHKGRSVTLQLDPNVGEQHPFKSLKCGENGSRLMLVAVLIGDDETPQAKPEAQRSASNDIPIKQGKPFKEMPLSSQCALMCSDPRFIEWLGCETEAEAEHVIKTKLGIMSRKELLTNPYRAQKWRAIHTSYEIGEPYAP